MNRKTKIKSRNWSDTGSLKAVRRELVRASFADTVAVQIALKNFWRPAMIWRSVKFIFKNQQRKKILATMSRAKMGFNWRCSLPKKKQRELGIIPKLQ